MLRSKGGAVSPFSMKDFPWWTRAWTWFRRWGWIPAAVILAILAFVLGGFLFRRREDGKILDPLTDIKDAVDRNNRKIDGEILEAEHRREEAIERIEAEHRAQIEKLDEQQQERRRELRRNPKKLARWLTRLATEDDAK
jgi:hypothetical protein